MHCWEQNDHDANWARTDDLSLRRGGCLRARVFVCSLEMQSGNEGQTDRTKTDRTIKQAGNAADLGEFIKSKSGFKTRYDSNLHIVAGG